jgi:hypothetical protein
MGFFEKIFLRHKREDPLPALMKAIFNATHGAAEKLRPLGGMEGTEIKKEDFLRYEWLHSELLYFYMHITLRLAHGQHFSEPEIKRLQQNLFPVIIEGNVEGPMGHWPEEEKAVIKAQHYENLDSAEFQYASCKGVYPTDDPLAMGNSVYATLARNIEKHLGLAHNPELSLQIILEVSEQLRSQPFPKLIAAARGKAL